MSTYNKSYYQRNKKRLKKRMLEYQKSEKYKAYRREYEADYRKEHSSERSLSAIKSMRKANGKRMSLIQETDYLLRHIIRKEQKEAP